MLLGSALLVGWQLPAHRHRRRAHRSSSRIPPSSHCSANVALPGMPSFFIRNCRADRFNPKRVAAPFGPERTQFVSFRVAEIGSRSACFRVWRLPSPCGCCGTSEFGRRAFSGCDSICRPLPRSSASVVGIGSPTAPERRREAEGLDESSP